MASPDVLALIPARAGSKSIPNKNFRELVGMSPVRRAVMCAKQAGITRAVVSSDAVQAVIFDDWLDRPDALAQDDTPMIDVVQHALREIPGPPDQIVLLIQPTQPLRQPKHLRAAIDALTSEWDSVVTITPIPRTHAPVFVLGYDHVTLSTFPWGDETWAERPTRRQAVRWPYIADGTAYAFRRRTVEEHGTIFGEYVRGIIIDPEETCPLDTPEDWLEAERRLRALSEVPR